MHGALRSLAVLSLAFLSSSCGKSSTSPTPPPVQATGFAVTGTVHESKPTDTIGVAGVVVQVVGQTALTATTSSSGTYTINNVPAGAYTLRASKTGYDPTDVSLTVAASSQQDFALTPAFQVVNKTESGSVSTGTRTCLPTLRAQGFYQGSQALPTMGCGGFSLPIHHDGTLTAQLTWSGLSDALGLVLIDRSTGAIVAVASQSPTTTEKITVAVKAGTQYVLGVIVNPQTNGSSYSFTLTITRPN